MKKLMGVFFAVVAIQVSPAVLRGGDTNVHQTGKKPDTSNKISRKSAVCEKCKHPYGWADYKDMYYNMGVSFGYDFYLAIKEENGKKAEAAGRAMQKYLEKTNPALTDQEIKDVRDGYDQGLSGNPDPRRS